MAIDEMEAGLPARLQALPPPARAELSTSCGHESGRRDPVLLGNPETGTFGELLIDLQEDRMPRAVMFGLQSEMERQ